MPLGHIRLVTRQSFSGSASSSAAPACRPLLHAVVGRYAASAWGVEIDRVKADKGNAFMRYAAAHLAKRNAAWTDYPVPAIRCMPVEEVRCPPWFRQHPVDAQNLSWQPRCGA